MSCSRFFSLSIKPSLFAHFHFLPISELCLYFLRFISAASSSCRSYRLWTSSSPFSKYPLTELPWLIVSTNMCISACSPSKCFLHIILGSTIHILMIRSLENPSFLTCCILHSSERTAKLNLFGISATVCRAQVGRQTPLFRMKLSGVEPDAMLLFVSLPTLWNPYACLSRKFAILRSMLP